MKEKEIIRNVLIIFGIFIFAVIPWAPVFGIQDPDLLEASLQFQHTGGFVLIIAMILRLIYKYYRKPLNKEMKEEEIWGADQKDDKALAITPTIGVLVVLLIFTSIPLLSIISYFTGNKDDFDLTLSMTGLLVFSIWGWYKLPTFTFTEDSVQIKSYLFYVFGIDRKKIIRYADITSVGPDPKVKGYMCGMDRRHWMVVSTNGTKKTYGLAFYNGDVIAEIYQRFREKLRDR